MGHCKPRENLYDKVRKVNDLKWNKKWSFKNWLKFCQIHNPYNYLQLHAF